MKIGIKKRTELEDYATHWLAYYNHMDIFDGPVPMNTARLLVESSINDELRKQAKDLVENILKRIPNKVRVMEVEMYVYWKSEAHLWTVGYYRPDGTRETESDHASPEAAAERVHWLNGGK